MLALLLRLTRVRLRLGTVGPRLRVLLRRSQLLAALRLTHVGLLLGKLLGATLHLPAHALIPRVGCRLLGSVLRRTTLDVLALLLRVTRVRLRLGKLLAALRLGGLTRRALLRVTRLPLATGGVPGGGISMTHDDVHSVQGTGLVA